MPACWTEDEAHEQAIQAAVALLDWQEKRGTGRCKQIRRLEDRWLLWSGRARLYGAETLAEGRARREGRKTG